jgi:transcription elongation GreA/GreB family factor
MAQKKLISRQSVDGSLGKNVEALQGQVVPGCLVHILLNGREKKITIVDSALVDPSAGRISKESPLGKCVLGASRGDRRTYEVNGRCFEVVVVSV